MRRVEPFEVDAVAEHREPVGRHPQPAEGRQVLRVLQQLGVGARGGEPLEAVDDGPLRPGVLGQGVEPVHRVDDHGDPGQPGGQPTVDARLRVVGVDDGRPEPPEQPDQLDQRPGVLGRGHRAGGVGERHVLDAPPRQRSTYGPGADAPTTWYPAAAMASSCGPSSSSRLMSVVVTCTTVGGPVAHVVAPA